MYRETVGELTLRLAANRDALSCADNHDIAPVVRFIEHVNMFVFSNIQSGAPKRTVRVWICSNDIQCLVRGPVPSDRSAAAPSAGWRQRVSSN